MIVPTVQYKTGYHKWDGLMDSMITYLADTCWSPAIDIGVKSEEDTARSLFMSLICLTHVKAFHSLRVIWLVRMRTSTPLKRGRILHQVRQYTVISNMFCLFSPSDILWMHLEKASSSWIKAELRPLAVGYSGGHLNLQTGSFIGKRYFREGFWFRFIVRYHDRWQRNPPHHPAFSTPPKEI